MLFILNIKNLNKNVMVKCTYCGSNWNIQHDHIISKPGDTKITVPACVVCHESRGETDIHKWLRWLKNHQSYRWNRIVEYQRGQSTELSEVVRNILIEN